MAKFHLTNKAVDDLSNIWEYTLNEWSEKQADKYYELIITSCKELSQNPKIGKSYNDVSENALGYLAHKHIIIYKIIKPNEIEVLRILHSSMDLKKRMED